jgi:hypothetical protein
MYPFVVARRKKGPTVTNLMNGVYPKNNFSFKPPLNVNYMRSYLVYYIFYLELF